MTDFFKSSVLWAYSRADVAPKKDQENGINFYGKTTHRFRQNVISGWKALPGSMADFLTVTGFQLNAGGVMYDIPSARDGGLVGDPYGRTQANHSCGFYISSTHEAHVSEFFLHPKFNQHNYPNPSLSSVITGKWGHAYPAAQIVLHESFHGYDRAIGAVIGTNLSSFPQFISSYESDLKNLGGYDAAGMLGQRYFARPDAPEIGRKEALAEIMSQQAQGNNKHYLLQYWKNTSNFLLQHKQEFLSGYQFGHRHKQFRGFLKKMHSDASASTPHRNNDYSQLRREHAGHTESKPALPKSTPSAIIGPTKNSQPHSSRSFKRTPNSSFTL